MTYTGFARTNAGQTVYAQTRPAEDVVDWVATAIAGTEDSTVAGQYRFPGLEESGSYECYVQSGASPARTDLPFWEFLPTGTGLVDYPAESDVRAGISYDSGQKTGILVLPTENQVQFGVEYGANGEFTGTLASAGGSIPEIEDVRFGVSYGTGQIGTLQLPVESVVLIGIGYGAYGTEFEGTLQDLPGGVGQVLPPVLGNGQLRSPLIVGDAYIAELETSFIWTIDSQTGMVAAGTTARFYGRIKCGGCDGETAWDIDGTVTEDGSSGLWTLEFEMPGSETSKIAAGEYEWFLVLEEQGDSLTVVSGEVEWICR